MEGARSTDTRGQVLPLVALVIGLAGVLLLGLLRLAPEIGTRDSARGAAELVALAAASGGRQAADQVATANGVGIVAYAVNPTGVRVTVGRDEVRATAQATTGPATSPALHAVLSRARQVLGGDLTVRAWGADGLSLAVDTATASRLREVPAVTGLCPALAGASSGSPTESGLTWFEICRAGER